MSAFSNKKIRCIKNFMLLLASFYMHDIYSQVCFSPATTFSSGPSPISIVRGDFNSDGNSDLAVANSGSNLISIFSGDGAGNFSFTSNHAIASNPIFLLSADFNNDNKVDLVALNGSLVSILFGSGTGNFTVANSVGSGAGTMIGHAITVGDYNGDGNTDIATYNSLTNYMNAYFGDGAGGFPNATTRFIGANPSGGIFSKDLNNDGKSDVVIMANNVAVFLAVGTNSFSAANNFSAGSHPAVATFGDFNSDSEIDIAVGDNTDNTVSLLLGNGTGSFSAATSFAVGTSPSSIEIGLFNNDTKVDVITSNYGSGNVSVLISTGTGSFQPAATFTVGSSPLSLVIDDFNGDTKHDFATVSGPSDNVFVRLNTIAPTLTATPSYSICEQSTAVLNATGVNTYNWSNGVINNVAFTPTTTITYTVSGVDTEGCTTDFSTTTVTVAPLPAVTISTSTTAICFGNSVTLNSSGSAATYTWSNGVTDATAFSPTSTATYSLTGTAANGCTNTAVKTITVNSLPNVAAASKIVCFGTSVTLSGTGASTYTWSNGVINGAAFTPTITTTYTVTGLSASGCANTAQATVTVEAVPSLTITETSTVICNGMPVTLTASGANTYTWTNGVVNATPYFPASTLVYTVTGRGINNCLSSLTTTVYVNQLPVITANTSNTICSGTNYTVNATGALTYTWSNSLVNGSVISPTNSVTYTIQGTDANGCVGSSLSTLTVQALPAVYVSASDTICREESMVLVAYGGPYTYTWSTSQTTPTISVSPTVTTTYTAVTIDGNGCVNSATTTVFVNACVGIRQYSIDNSSITIYPNPASDYFILKATGDETVKINIYDLLGKSVLQRDNVKNGSVINTNDLKKGIYNVEIKTENGTLFTEKIIIN